MMTDVEFEPVLFHEAHRRSRWLITCDHASNNVPPSVGGGDLGLSAEDMARHIAYDVGAAGVTRALADSLNAPAVLSNVSRLVIDPNRGEQDPTLLMKLYDGSVIPANKDADAAEKARRLAAYHAPYHAAISGIANRQTDTVIVAIHSFTPQLNGRPPRPWHIGVLHNHDGTLSDPLLHLLRAQADLCVGDNEPYVGHLPGDSIDRHALRQNRANTLIEIRNDLIETPDDQLAWGRRLAPLLQDALHLMETDDDEN